MVLIDITSKEHLDKFVYPESTKLSIIDFHASWCPPCKVMATPYQNLSNTYPDVNFLKYDVDLDVDRKGDRVVDDISGKYGVQTIPTFVFVKNNKEVGRVKRANIQELEEAVKKHATSSSGAGASFPGMGHSLSNDSTSPPILNAGRSEGIVSDIYAYYSGLDPQLKTLLWVLVAYLGFMKLS